MKNKVFTALFIIICLLVCAVPLVTMPVAPSDDTLENKKAADFPEIKKEGKINLDFFDEFDNYFSENIAFRGYLVALDARIQSLFGVSSVDTVIKGSDGWLYYTSTSDDYTGENTASDRKIFNAAHNISLMQKYVENQGASFVFTIAPNKNSLYPENMPYYYFRTDNENNMAKLSPVLAEYNINYVDLFSAFASQDEILYLKEDSHWNNKGAVLAYNEILDFTGKAHEDYSSLKPLYEARECSDLGKMLYAYLAQPEKNYFYDTEESFTYVTKTKSVEDPLIVTANENGTGNLLMFRDSFGNTLLPLFADNFSNACFSKGEPYLIGKFTEMYSPDIVIAEIVERNVMKFASDPPVMKGIEFVPDCDISDMEDVTGNISIEESFNDFEYMKVYGNIDCQQEYSDVYIAVNGSFYEAFTVSDLSSDNGYIVYIPKIDIPSGSYVCLYVRTEDKIIKAADAVV